MSDKDIVLVGYDNPAEQKAIQGAISVLKTMGMLAKLPYDDCENFVLACAEMKLNPILKEVYAVAYYNSELKRETVGIITDYKVFLDRAEMSGKLDGWGTEWDGEVVKKTITKKAKKKDGSGYYDYNADVIDKTKTTLKARIIIRRKDWSQPYVSRWMRLIDEMKDTPFWHDDPYGMLEKNCIRDHMQKVFRQECRGIVDQSREVNIPEYQVVGNTPTEPLQAPVNQMELLNMAKECDTLLNSFSMVSTETAEYRNMIKSAIADKDLTKLEHIAVALHERKERAIAAHKAEKAVEVEYTPVEQPTPAEDVQPVPEQEQEVPVNPAGNDNIISVLKELFAIGDYPMAHKRNSLNKHLPSVFIAPESHDWESAVMNASIPEAEGKAAIAYYKSCIPKAKKLQKDKETKKQDYKAQAIAMIDKYPDGDVKDELMGHANAAENEASDSDAWKLILDQANEYYEAVINESK